MRRHRTQVTILGMMIVVAITGSAVGILLARQRRFESLAAYHRSKVIHVDVRYKSTVIDGNGDSHTTEFWKGIHGKDLSRHEVAESDWHAALAEKYWTASARPWLPLEIDLPSPAP
jgi:hypothetical protein